MVDGRAGKARERLRTCRQLQWFGSIHRYVQKLQAWCGVSICDGHAWEQLSVLRPKPRWKGERNGRMLGTTLKIRSPPHVALTK